MRGFVRMVDQKLDALGDEWKDKSFRIPTNLLGGCLFFLIALGVLLIMPDQVAVSAKDVVNGRAFPTMLMVIMMLCCAVLIIKEVVCIVRKQPVQFQTINLLTEIKALIILGILLITYCVSRFSGLFVVGACVCSLGFLLFFRCKKPAYYAVTLALAVSIWASFRFVLGVNF